MEPIEYASIGLLVVAFGAISMKIERWPVTMPMVFVSAGALADAVGLVDGSTEPESIAILAEITLAVILFTDASRINFTRLHKFLAIPVRLLGIGLPLVIAVGAAMNALLFPDLPFAQVALIAAILAPTDAALGSAVVEDDAVPARERLSLTVESGLNDGLVVPVVAVLTAMVIGESRSTGSWVGFVAAQIGWGVGLGVVLGGGAITLLRAAHRRGWSDGRYEQLATFVVPIVALFAAEQIGGNSFIAAFVAGLAFGSIGGDEPCIDDDQKVLSTRFGEFTEDAAQLLALATFFAFGNVLLADAISHFTVTIALCAVLTLTVGRIVPVWISLIGTSLPGGTRLFIGWFGPRGLASTVFGLLLLDDTEAMSETGEQLFAVIALTVTASVFLHGASAAWGARAYGDWVERRGDYGDDEVDHEMVTRARWARSRD